jgi:hypothetical protein
LKTTKNIASRFMKKTYAYFLLPNAYENEPKQTQIWVAKRIKEGHNRGKW